MGKKNKDEAPNPNSIPNRDIIQRLNFLYQASSYLNGIAGAQSGTEPRNAAAGPANGKVTPENDASSGPGEKERETVEVDEGEHLKSTSGDTPKRPGQRKATARDLARSYVKSMKIIGQKTNVKMDPSVKRTICKGCNTLLMPGVTAKVRVKPLPPHGHAVSYTCINCSFSRRIPAPPTAEQAPRPGSSQLSKEPDEPAEHMAIDPVDALLDAVKMGTSNAPRKDVDKQKSRPRKRKTKRSIKPHPLPFFARPEHTLYIGNHRVDQNLEDGGLD